MSDFVSNELQTINVGINKWVKIPKEISFGEVQAFTAQSDDNTSSALEAIVSLIREWNIEGDDDRIAEISVESLKRLPLKIYRKIDSSIVLLMKEDKKKG